MNFAKKSPEPESPEPESPEPESKSSPPNEDIDEFDVYHNPMVDFKWFNDVVKNDQVEAVSFDYDYSDRTITKENVLLTPLSLSTYNKNLPNIRHGIWTSIPDDAHILCVQYGVGRKDIQIGITGTALKKEKTFTETMIREIKEETGLEMKNPLQLVMSDNTVGFNKTWKWTVLDISDMKALETAPESESKSQDNWKRKIGAIIYTTDINHFEDMIRQSARNGGLALLE